ncbi:MAG: alpha-L-fucosidase [Halobacteriaceae archaeon]
MTERRGEWFDEAGLGLFVHWGIASAHGGVDLSWGMMRNRPWTDDPGRGITPEEYYALAEEFDPDAYDPDRWLAAAREAGMEYAVLTTRHHDGFALWPSEHGEFSTAQYLDGRDLVGEFVDACRRQGVRVGFYYSPPDWNHPATPDPVGDYEEWRERHEASWDPEAEREFYEYVKGQVRELVTRYGDLDVFWFDGSVPSGAAELYDVVRGEQPGILVNDRCDSSLGDFSTPETELPQRPVEGRWELCYTWGGPGWGHVADETYRDLAWTTEHLAKTVGRGGNLLLNVGPKGDGSLPEAAYERLDELAAWMREHRPAVKGVRRGPWPPRADAEVPVTRDGPTWYLHVLEAHDGPVTVAGVPEPRRVTHLRTGEALDYEFDGGDLTVAVPADARERPDEVVALTWDHPVASDVKVDGRFVGVPE